MAADQPAPFRAPHASRQRGETVPGAHLAGAVARVYSEEATQDGYPSHVPEDLRPARGILLATAAAVVFYAVVIIVAMVIS